jgi:drug/metabolite transporter (DMT)-like permease
MVVGALLLGGSNALVSYAELHVSSGLAAVLAALVPLWLAVFSMATESLGPKGWAGIALGIAGVAVLVWPSGGLRIHAGGLAALVAAPLIWAWGTLHGKHFVHGGGLMTNVGIQMLTAALIGLAAAPLTGGYLRGPLTHKALFAVGYLALFGSLLAFSAYIYLAKAWPPAKMGTYAYLNPLVAVLLGSVVLHEAFGLREVLGMTIILAAVALVQLRAKAGTKAST